jgi:4a-hydroxytetrahydrobiopterin dehydratase
MPREKLNQQEIAARLQRLPEWQLRGEEIIRIFQFKDFVESMKFVNKVAEIAEAAQHHPDILINWNKVTLSLTTHDSGGLTRNDFDLAAKIDQLT